MNNPRITPKDRALIIGALRRAFSRSELHRRVLERSVIAGYTDPTRPRVKKWCVCELCSNKSPKYKMSVDHKDPVIPVFSSFALMPLDETVERMWCEESNLQTICEPCHDSKTKIESGQRKHYRDLNKPPKKKVDKKKRKM